MVRNNITGKGYVIARSDIVVNCDDPMVECDGLHHILSSRHRQHPSPAGAVNVVNGDDPGQG